MNIEERAENVMSIFRCMLIETIDGQVLTGIDLMNRIAEALRDQVEDCAKIIQNEIDEWNKISIGSSDFRVDALEEVLGRIRALAAPTESKTEEEKGIKDRFKPGGFWNQ